MKTVLLKMGLIFLFVGLIGASCHDENKTKPADPCQKTTDDLTGKWKLTFVTTVFEKIDTTHYSDNNIVFDFQGNKTAIITSDIEDYIGPDPGEYPYTLTPSEFVGICYVNLGPFFSSENRTSCIISDDELIINNSALDGPIYYFTRIQ